jgi:hypothetical protein
MPLNLVRLNFGLVGWSYDFDTSVRLSSNAKRMEIVTSRGRTSQSDFRRYRLSGSIDEQPDSFEVEPQSLAP